VPKLGNLAERLATIPGQVPNPARFPSGCKFHPRCPRTRELAGRSKEQDVVSIRAGDEIASVMRVCTTEEPVLREVGPHHGAACRFADNYPQAPLLVPRLDHHREVVPDVLDASGDVPPDERVMQEVSK